MSWVKICGLTNLDDALVAIEAGADALGFVLDPSSPRFISHQKLEDLLPRLPRHVKTVAVFGPFIRSSVMDIFDMVQSFDKPTGFEGTSIEARKVGSELTEAELRAEPVFGEMVLLDGGSGAQVELELAARVVVASDHRVILAGGLNVENVGEAIRTSCPWGVDVSSGVEIAIGRKDHQKLRDFLRAVHRA